MFPGEGSKSWLLRGCQSLGARVSYSVCKQSMIAKKDVNGAHVFSGILDCLKTAVM